MAKLYTLVGACAFRLVDIVGGKGITKGWDSREIYYVFVETPRFSIFESSFSYYCYSMMQ